MTSLPAKTVFSLPHEITAAMRENRALILIIVIYAAAAIGIASRLGIQHDAAVIFAGFGASELIGPIFALCGYAIYVMIFIRPTRLTRFLLTNIRQYLSRARLLNALPVLFLFPVFASSFTILKSAVPIIHPYAWDVRLAQWDLALHGGTEPWMWLQPLTGNPAFTALINYAYHLWFFVMLWMFYWLAFTIDRPKLRAQYLLSFVISWIFLGTIIATVFSSAGPCYYGLLIAGHDPYAPLMSYLREADKVVPVLALDVQKMLWDGYQTTAGKPAVGISAMPSMHVATAVLLALLGWRLNRAAGIALTLFALVIMIGSVHLGWHYALDGYVGAAGAYVIWRGVGWSLSRSGVADQSAVSSASSGNLNLSPRGQADA